MKNLLSRPTLLFTVALLGILLMQGDKALELLAAPAKLVRFDPAPVVPVGVVSGLEYAYYELDNSLESQRPVKEGVVETFDVSLFDRETDFAFRFTGYLSVSVQSNYQFQISAVDYARLLIGDETVVIFDPTSDQGPQQSEPIALQPGFYTLRADYSRAGVAAAPAFQVEWSSDLLAMSEIPTANLFRDDPDITPTPTAVPTVTSTPTATPQGGTTTLLPTSTATPRASAAEAAQRLYLPSITLPINEQPFVYFAGLSNDDIVLSPFELAMGAANFTIEPAGNARTGAGHFHLMIDVPCVEPGQTIPFDNNHRHYGDGAMTVTLELPPGTHTLCLQAGDGLHTALNLTREITLMVTEASTEQSIRFVSPANGTVLNGMVELEMAAENFVIEAAGASIPGHGHFHLLIDEPCVTPGNTIPMDATHIHYGQGQESAQLELDPGTYTLCLQAGDGFHTALDLTQVVTITVQMVSEN